MSIRTHAPTHACTHQRMHAHTLVSRDTYATREHTYTHTHTHTHAHTHVHTDTDTDKHAHTHTHYSGVLEGTGQELIAADDENGYVTRLLNALEYKEDSHGLWKADANRCVQVAHACSCVNDYACAFIPWSTV
jgi:hypothetical protein